MRGISAGDVVLTRHASVPDKAILRLSRKTGKNWHWMLIWNGRIYDPAESWEQRVSEGWQVTSFMPLEGC
jgi:hypothetical protein